jgi:hypothetical protein
MLLVPRENEREAHPRLLRDLPFDGGFSSFASFYIQRRHCHQSPGIVDGAGSFSISTN